jgi:hypothetical protein
MTRSIEAPPPIQLARKTGIERPEEHHDRLRTIELAVDYLVERAGAARPGTD